MHSFTKLRNSADFDSAQPAEFGEHTFARPLSGVEGGGLSLRLSFSEFGTEVIGIILFRAAP